MVNNLGTNGVSFAKFDYGYDTVDRRTFVKRDSSLGDVFKYDQIDQVTNVLYNASNPDSSPSGATNSVFYVHDSVGNRTSVTDGGSSTSYTPNNLNEYTAVGAVSPTYSTDGNLITYGNWSYAYDSYNRLTGATNISASVSASFNYDGRNRRVKQSLNGTNTFFYFDGLATPNGGGWNLIQEHNSSNTELNSYVHGAKIDELLVKVNGGGSVYYHQDSIGNTVALTGSGGAVVEKVSYGIYGTPSFTDGSGTPIAGTAYDNRFLFTGREYIAELEIYDYRERPYIPELGRFPTPDPIRFDSGDYNIYRYVGNNPTNATDPKHRCA